MKTILIIGTLDTKGQELRFIRDLIWGRKHKTLLLGCERRRRPAISCGHFRSGSRQGGGEFLIRPA